MLFNGVITVDRVTLWHAPDRFNHQENSGLWPSNGTSRRCSLVFPVFFHEQWVLFQSKYSSYPLVNCHMTMENHNCSWENSLFQWQFSIAMLNYHRVATWSVWVWSVWWMHYIFWFVVSTYPSEKYESVGMITFPTEWKVIKFHGSKPPTSLPFFP